MADSISPPSYPFLLDRVDHIGQIQAEPPSFDDKALDVVRQRSALACARRGLPPSDGGADPRARLEQLALHERCNGLHRSVGIDLKLLAEGSNRRKRVAGPELSGDDRLR